MNEEQAPPEKVTVEQLDGLVKEIVATRKAIETLEAQVSEHNKAYQKLQGRAVLFLKALGRENYQTPLGTMGIRKSISVKIPQNDLAKREFFEWLRNKGIFDRYATVNSQSLKSLYQAELEAVERESPEEALTFTIPGIEPATYYETLGFRKA